MPRMDGFQATAEIRRREAGRRRVPIIAMTASAQVEDRQRCLAAGMDGFLSKPVKERELELVLGRWTGPAGAGPVSAGAAQEAYAAGAVPTDGVLDAEQVTRLHEVAASSGDPDFLRVLVDRFVDESAGQLDRLWAAAAAGDAEAVRSTAHALMGSSATMGAGAVAGASAAMEAAAADGRLPGPEHLRGLAAELERAAAALQAVVGAG